MPALAGMGVAALTWTTHLFLPVLLVASSFAVFILGDRRLPWLQGYNRLRDYSYGTLVYSLLIKQGVTRFSEASALLNIAIARPVTVVIVGPFWHLIEEGLSLSVRSAYMLTRHRTSRLWLERRPGSV